MLHLYYSQPVKKKNTKQTSAMLFNLMPKAGEFNLHLGTHWTPLSLEWTTRVTETHENFYS